jgi:hypothetical protein
MLVLFDSPASPVLATSRTRTGGLAVIARAHGFYAAVSGGRRPGRPDVRAPHRWCSPSMARPPTSARRCAGANSTADVGAGAPRAQQCTRTPRAFCGWQRRGNNHGSASSCGGFSALPRLTSSQQRRRKWPAVLDFSAAVRLLSVSERCLSTSSATCVPSCPVPADGVAGFAYHPVLSTVVVGEAGDGRDAKRRSVPALPEGTPTGLLPSKHPSPGRTPISRGGGICRMPGARRARRAPQAPDPRDRRRSPRRRSPRRSCSASIRLRRAAVRGSARERTGRRRHRRWPPRSSARR